MSAFSAIAFIALLLLSFLGLADAGIINGTNTSIPNDLNGSNFTYQWPVNLYRFSSQQQHVEMAFMDVQPTSAPNGRVAVLLHGKNFCGPTWNGTAKALAGAGYRVILPDQIGFCKSTKPSNYQFSLHQLALNTHNLLSELGIISSSHPIIMGHSMGGMLATRYSLMYPTTTASTVLINPIGLEDWKAEGIPYQSIDTSFASELSSNYSSIRAYEQSTYYVNTWAPQYDIWARMLAAIYAGSHARAFAYNQAQTTDMVLTQPVVYEFPRLRTSTLLLIGERDTTVIGKAWAPDEVVQRLGQYDVLGERAAKAMPDAELVEFADLGHAPQIQEPGRVHGVLLGWLEGVRGNGTGVGG